MKKCPTSFVVREKSGWGTSDLEVDVVGETEGHQQLLLMGMGNDLRPERSIFVVSVRILSDALPFKILHCSFEIAKDWKP